MRWIGSYRRIFPTLSRTALSSYPDILRNSILPQCGEIPNCQEQAITLIEDSGRLEPRRAPC
jgi:hypothetical protein